MAPNESPTSRQVPLLQFIVALLLLKSKPNTLSCTGEQRHSPIYQQSLIHPSQSFANTLPPTLEENRAREVPHSLTHTLARMTLTRLRRLLL